MGYYTLHNDLKDPGYPPVLAQMVIGTKREPTKLYLSIPRVWVEVGPTLGDEIRWGGDWDGAPGEGPDATIKIIAQRRHPLEDGVKFWLHYFDHKTPEVVVINADGSRNKATVPDKGWGDISDDEIVPDPDPEEGVWYEMEMWESAAIVRTMQHGWF